MMAHMSWGMSSVALLGLPMRVWLHHHSANCRALSWDAMELSSVNRPLVSMISLSNNWRRSPMELGSASGPLV